jgi:hypothetical protein
MKNVYMHAKLNINTFGYKSKKFEKGSLKWSMHKIDKKSALSPSACCYGPVGPLLINW